MAAPLRISARSHYAIRIVAHLALAGHGTFVKADTIADEQNVPRRFLNNIIADLRDARLVVTQRGADGGTALARPAASISLADVLASAPTEPRPEPSTDRNVAGSDVWALVQRSIEQILHGVTVDDIALGKVPEIVRVVNTSTNLELRAAPAAPDEWLHDL